MRLRKGRVVYEGMELSLSELRSLGRTGWTGRVPRCSVFIIPKDRGKLSYFWRHAFLTAKCGPELGGVINPDTGVCIENPEGGRRTRLDFDNLKIGEQIERSQCGTTVFSPLWQADGKKIQRMAPVEFIGRYMKGWFDLAIADELHQLAGLSAGPNNGEERGQPAIRPLRGEYSGITVSAFSSTLFGAIHGARFRVSPARPGDPGRVSILAACPDEPPLFQAHYALSPNWIERNGLSYPGGHVRARPGLR